jgi:hypothetical protein
MGEAAILRFVRWGVGSLSPSAGSVSRGVFPIPSNTKIIYIGKIEK